MNTNEKAIPSDKLEVARKIWTEFIEKCRENSVSPEFRYSVSTATNAPAILHRVHLSSIPATDIHVE